MRLTHLLALTASFSLLAACEKQAETTEAEATAAPEAVAADSGGLPVSTGSADAISSYNDGWTAFDFQRFNEAVDHFKAATAGDPDFAMAHFMAALASPSTEEFAAGLAKAVELAPKASRGEQLMIESIQKAFAGDQQGQLAALTEVVEMYPASARALQFLAFAQTNQNDIAGARETLGRALDLKTGQAATHMQIGNNYLFQEPKDFDKAEMHFKAASALAPGEPNPHDLLGDVHRAQNKLEAAYEDYTRASELAPYMGSPLQQRAHVSSFLGNYDAAREDYTKSAELEMARGTAFGPNFLLYRAIVSLHEGKPDAAISEMRELAAGIDPTSSGALDNQILLLTNAVIVATHIGNVDTAGEVINEVAALMRQQAEGVGTEEFASAQEANITYLEGMIAARKGDKKGAAAKAADFKKHVAKNTNPRKLERMHEILGYAAYHQGDYAAATEHLAAGDVVNNDYTKYCLALSHEGAGDSEAARQLLEELAVWNFNSATYAMTRADILARVSGG